MRVEDSSFLGKQTLVERETKLREYRLVATSPGIEAQFTSIYVEPHYELGKEYPQQEVTLTVSGPQVQDGKMVLAQRIGDDADSTYYTIFVVHMNKVVRRTSLGETRFGDWLFNARTGYIQHTSWLDYCLPPGSPMYLKALEAGWTPDEHMDHVLASLYASPPTFDSTFKSLLGLFMETTVELLRDRAALHEVAVSEREAQQKLTEVANILAQLVDGDIPSDLKALLGSTDSTVRRVANLHAKRLLAAWQIVEDNAEQKPKKLLEAKV